MKGFCGNKSNRALLTLFLPTMAVYILIFATAFAELPIAIGPIHLLLLLYFHFVPMFFLELLLCRLTRPLWRILIPALLLAGPVLWFVSTAEFHVLAWLLAGRWCMAPVIGGLLGYFAWRAESRSKGKPQ